MAGQKLTSLLVITIYIFSVFACKGKSGYTNYGYINYEKWMLPGNPEGAFLKGKPKEVEIHTERHTKYDTGKSNKTNKEIYRFDEEGNLVYRLITIDTIARSETIFRYDADGEQATSCFSNFTNKPDSCEIRTSQKSKRLGDGSFLVTDSSSSGRHHKQIRIYEKNKVTFKLYRRDTLFDTRVRYFDNGRMARYEAIDDKLTLITLYHRNTKGWLDSTTDNVDYEKKFFIYNKQGDPIFQLTKSNNTTEKFHYEYEYDSVGNWIKRIETEEDNPSDLRVIETRKFTYR